MCGVDSPQEKRKQKSSTALLDDVIEARLPLVRPALARKRAEAALLGHQLLQAQGLDLSDDVIHLGGNAREQSGVLKIDSSARRSDNLCRICERGCFYSEGRGDKESFEKQGVL